MADMPIAHGLPFRARGKPPSGTDAMLGRRSAEARITLMAADALATGAAFLLAYYLAGRGLERLGFRVVLPLSRYLWVLAVSVPMVWILLGLFRQYDLMRLQSAREVATGLTRPMLLNALIIGAAAFGIKEEFISRRIIGFLALANFATLLLARLLALQLLASAGQRSRAWRNLLVIGSSGPIRPLAETLRRQAWGLHVTGRLAWSPEQPDADDPTPLLGTVGELSEVLERHVIDDVILAEAAGGIADLRSVIRRCEELGVQVHVAAGLFDPVLAKAHVQSFCGIQLLTFTPVPFDAPRLAVKRALDVLVSAMVLCFFAPFFILVMLAARLSSPGRAIYRQERCGLNGRPFMMLKFRSMYLDAEHRLAEVAHLNVMGGPAFKALRDPRVTPLGHILRRYSLDEVPQFWNVLVGDMSLVGPRPSLPREINRYERWQRRRLSMRPGLTCLWQVHGRRRPRFEEWMKLDLEYIDRWSLLLDMDILIRTLSVVMAGTGR